MKCLDITKLHNNEELVFDEFMNVEGCWIKEKVKYIYSSVIKLKYGTQEFDYYIQQSENELHTLLRNKIL